MFRKPTGSPKSKAEWPRVEGSEDERGKGRSNDKQQEMQDQG